MESSRPIRLTDTSNLLVSYPRNEEEYSDYTFKMIFIGDVGVGKTCTLQRFQFGTYSEKHASTIGVDFSIKTLKMDDGKIVQLHIWDTAGQERYKTITQTYYRNAHGVLLAYDITRERTFYNLSNWLDDIRKYCGTKTLVYVVGTKLDLVTSNVNQREVTPELVQTLLDTRRDIIGHTELSAKHGTNVDTAFKELTVAMRKKVDRSITSDCECELSRAYQSGNLDTRPIDNEMKKKCC